jgi:hypothetical protein
MDFVGLMLEGRVKSIVTEPTLIQERNEINSVTKRIFISADHGMAIIYFLQSDVVREGKPRLILETSA